MYTFWCAWDLLHDNLKVVGPSVASMPIAWRLETPLSGSGHRRRIEAVQQVDAGQVVNEARDSEVTPTLIPGREDQANLSPADAIAQLCQLPLLTQAMYVSGQAWNR